MLVTFIISRTINAIVIVGVSTTVKSIDTDTIRARLQSRECLVRIINPLIMLSILCRVIGTIFSALPACNEVIVVKSRIDHVGIGHINPCLLRMSRQRSAGQEKNSVQFIHHIHFFYFCILG